MRPKTAQEDLAVHDKQIAAMRALLREGIPMVAEIRRLTLETRKDLRAVAALQRRNSRRTTNGRTKNKA